MATFEGQTFKVSIAPSSNAIECKLCGAQYPVGGYHKCEALKVQHLFAPGKTDPMETLCGAGLNSWMPSTQEEADTVGICVPCHRKARSSWMAVGVRKAIKWVGLTKAYAGELEALAVKIEEGKVK